MQKTENEHKDIFIIKWEILRHDKEYRQEYKRFKELDRIRRKAEYDNTLWETAYNAWFGQYEKICNTYGLLYPGMPDKQSDWIAFDICNSVEVVSNKSPHIHPAKYTNAKERRKAELHAILQEDRFLNLKIDMFQSKKMIESELLQIFGHLYVETKQYLPKQSKMAPFIKKKNSTQTKTIKRMFRVYELRLQERRDDYILTRLYKEKLLEPNRDIEKIKNSIRQDYKRACELLKIPEELRKRKSPKKLKVLLRTPGAKNQKEVFEYWESKLSKNGLGEFETYDHKKGYVYLNNKSGPIAKKLRRKAAI